MSLRRSVALSFGVLLVLISLPVVAQDACTNKNTVTAKVVALDAPFFVNRLGAMLPEGMVYALERDVVLVGECPAGQHCPRAFLRKGKRPRPIVLRVNVGQCLSIQFKNLLTDAPEPFPNIQGVQPATRYAGVHVAGMQLVKSIMDDGSFVGVNPNSLVPPGGSITYLLRATAEGTFLLNSEGAAWGGKNQPNDGAQVTAGLFGAVNVEPEGAIWFRSQITYDDMQKAIDHSKGNNGFTPGPNGGQPILDYNSPVLRMLDSNNEIVYSDLTAIIAGPGKDFTFLDNGDPNTKPVKYEPNRNTPFREFTILYHELNDTQQAFPIFDYSGASLTKTLQAGGDSFAINYGSGGIGAEILANRFGLGPMNSCADCRFEEFFLSSWTVGDPAMVVDYPANAPCKNNLPIANPADVTNPAARPAPCTLGVKGNAPTGITPLRKATRTLYPDDPSNVYHSYINDRVIFRTQHAGTGVSHVHHLHAHQWFHSPNSEGSAYLDSQLINPGSAYTMEIAHLGSGNLNKVVGDSIFHCHFYPHFAAGMWAHWRSHDVFELGTELDAYGTPKPGSRALPDGEIAAGTPIPALVPMPALAMAPMPAGVSIEAVKDPNDPSGPPVGYHAVTNPPHLAAGKNPRFPFFIPGVGGTRAPHPPMDFAKGEVLVKQNGNWVKTNKELNGGLPRHLLINAKIKNEQHNYLDFSKDIDHVNAFKLLEEGEPVEKVAMAYHAQCAHPSFKAGTVTPADYRTNGLPAVSGAPYADPGISTSSNSNGPCQPIKEWIDYRAAVVQTDFVINKLGWHYPQSRLLTLWGDVLPTVKGTKPPEPFFIRANTHVGVNYWHTNLVPSYYDLDDYQVRTPTDIIGQHIHLVKFDVTSSDGAANGYNYEDGTLSYQEVEEIIDGVNECGGLAKDLASLKQCNQGLGDRTQLTADSVPLGICTEAEIKDPSSPCNGWNGAQTTVQRWYADPLDSPADVVNGERTLRTVFTHDHFGPSTHQQVGLYAALLVEPTKSNWFLNDAAKTPMRTRTDGGPTSWEAIIETPGAPEKNTYREFALALQDFQFAYLPTSKNKPTTVKGVEKKKGGGTAPVTVKDSWAEPCKAVEAPQIQGGNATNVAGGTVKDCTKSTTPTGPSIALQDGLGPQLVSAGPSPGTSSFNYRNEPLPYRVAPASSGSGAANSTDLSYVFASNVSRNIAALNSQPAPGTPIAPGSDFNYPPALTPGMQGGDPYTPLLRAYEGDRVQMRIIVGAHMLPHAFTVHGMKWLFEPSFDSSGWRSTQSMGISEHFEFIFETPRASPSSNASYNWSDYLYMPDASNQKHGIIDGTWGLFRAYKSKQSHLAFLPTNQDVKPLPATQAKGGYSCPPAAPVRAFTVSATTPPSSQIPFNSRGVDGAGKFPSTKIFNTYPMMYNYNSTTPPGGAATNVFTNIDEPLIIRANAGECTAVTLKNAFTNGADVFKQVSFAAFDPFKTMPLRASYQAGLAPALMSFDPMTSAGMNVGFNPAQTVGVGQQKTYYWYAGESQADTGGKVSGMPIEFGGVNLTPSDPLNQDRYGLIGGMIVEPQNTLVCADVLNPSKNPAWLTYASVTAYDGGTCKQPGKLRYREFVLVTQDDLSSLNWAGGGTACYCPAKTPTTGADCTPCFGPVENAIAAPLLKQTAVNYRTEMMPYRFNATSFVDLDYVWRGFSDAFVLGEPETPIFAAARNTPVRFHLLHPGGSGDQQVIGLHGHVWQELPYTSKPDQYSTAIGDNKLSMWLGKRDNYGTNMAYSIILEQNGGAGGQNGIMGDYLYRTTPANFVTQGLWGIFRVGETGADTISIAHATFSSGGLQVSGSNTVYIDRNSNAKNGQRASKIQLFRRKKGDSGNGTLQATVDVKEAGMWNYNSTPITLPDADSYEIIAVSPLGGRAIMPIRLALLPADVFPPTPPKSAQDPDPLGESIRFVNTPRTDEGQPKVPDAKPEEGHMAPPAPGTSQGTTPPPNP